MIDHVLTIDFETYWRKGKAGTKKRETVKPYTLDSHTTFEYVTHPDFQVLGASVKLDNEKVAWMTPAGFDWAARGGRPAIDWPRTAVLAHHTHFESLILAEHYGVRNVGLWLDTLSMDRALRPGKEHGLEFVAPHWCGMQKLEMPDFQGKRYEDLTSEEWATIGMYGVADAEITYRSFIEMMKVFPPTELRKIDLTLRMFNEPTFEIDEEILRPYAEEEKARRAAFLSRLGLGPPEEAKVILGSSDKFAAVLRSLGIEPDTKWTDSQKGWTYSFAKDDPFMHGLLEHGDEDIRDLAQARLDTKSTTNVTRPDRFLLLGAGGRRAPVYLAYAAAHTLRWGGGDKYNWQNLERLYSNKPRSGAIRRSIRAPRGHLVVKADSAQIEARKVAWLAGCTHLVEAFAQGRDVYSELASKLYGRKIDRKFKLPDGTRPDDIPGFIGKVCQLGLGYGMGWAKLAIEMLKGAFGGPRVIFTEADAAMMGVDVARFSGSAWNVKRVLEIPTRLDPRVMIIHCAVCEFLVDMYREVNPEIPELWKYGNEVIERMYLGDEGPAYRGTCWIVKDGLLLPSGHVLWYPDLYASGDTKRRDWMYSGADHKTTKVYGGLLTENVDQALCCIIVGDQMVEYADLGHPIGLMNHDEIASTSPEGQAHEDLITLLGIMKRTPGWCPGFPLAADGHVGTHYAE